MFMPSLFSSLQCNAYFFEALGKEKRKEGGGEEEEGREGKGEGKPPSFPVSFPLLLPSPFPHFPGR